MQKKSVYATASILLFFFTAIPYVGRCASDSSKDDRIIIQDNMQLYFLNGKIALFYGLTLSFYALSPQAL